MTMIRVALCTIPKYLHSSAFYKSLNFECETDEILVPADCYKEHDIINCAADFSVLLKVSLFWQIEQTLPSIVHFCCRHDNSSELEGVVDNLTESDLKKDLISLIKNQYIPFDSCPLLKAMWHNRSHLCHHLIGSNQVRGSITHTNHAAQHCQLEYLQWMHDHNYPVDRTTFEAAAESGSLECVKFVHTNLGVKIHKKLLSEVAQKGHAGVLEYLLEHTAPEEVEDCEWVVLDTAEKGHVDCLRVLHRAGAPMSWLQFTNEHWTKFNLEVIKFLHEELLFEFDGDSARKAADLPRARSNILKYIVECGVAFDEVAIFAIILCSNNIVLLRYLLEERRVPIPGSVLELVKTSLNRDRACVKYLRERGLL